MDYKAALEQTVVYIEKHLGEDIKVEEVTRAAGYSYYHLNRQFEAILGESVGGYIKHRRLAVAAKELLYTEKKIIDIALETGYESAEAFSRAFKHIYQISPRMYRKNRLETLLGRKGQLDMNSLNHLADNVTVHPRIVDLPEIKVAGLRGDTTLRDNRLRQLWERANAAYTQIPDKIPGGKGFGICEACQENTLYTMNDEVVFTEVAGVEVSSFDRLEKPFVKKVIPGGKYAVFTHRGTLRLLPQTFSYIWGTWLLSSKIEMDVREDFEMYDQRFIGYDHPDSEVDLYIPICYNKTIF